MATARPLLPTFLPSLNALLAALELPFALDHPTDLTPSLLLAIFESLLSARLPIPQSIRQSRTKDAKSRAMLVLLGVLECDILRGGAESVSTSNLDDSALAGAGGVSVDGWADEIGLGEVDPERLADGGWEETLFIGELLCWLARRKGILPRTKSASKRPSHQRSLYSNHHSYGDEGDSADFSASLLLRPSPAQKARSPSPSHTVPDTDRDISVLSHITDVPRHPRVHSPEPSLSASATTGTDLSIRARSVSSRTTVSNPHDDPDGLEEASRDTVRMYDPLRMMRDAEDDDDRPPSFRPRYIHELDDPSYSRALASFDEHVAEHEVSDLPRHRGDQYNDDLYAPPTPTPRRVRLTGWIDPVDAATELSEFAASRARARSDALHPSTSLASGSGSGLGSGSAPIPRSRPTPRQSTAVSPRPRPESTIPISRTPRRISPPPPLSPPPSPPPPPRTSTSKYTHSRLPPTRTFQASPSPSSPPSSPSPSPEPPVHSDPPFDVSFSTLNNTSTPAKPRPPRTSRRAPQPPLQILQPSTSTSASIVGTGTAAGTSTGVSAMGERRLRARSPSYTPSPPSFSAPGSSLRNTTPGTSVPGGASAGSTQSARVTKRGKEKERWESVSPPALSLSLSSASASANAAKAKAKAKATTTMTTMTTMPTMSMPSVDGSTAVTSTLLTERARLLTELAALKRARALSGGGGGSGANGAVLGTGVGIGIGARGSNSGRGVVGHPGSRVGVGV